MAPRILVLGATGTVGREMLTILHERSFPANNVRAAATGRSKGTKISFGDDSVVCENLDHIDFSNLDLCLMAAGGNAARQYARMIVKQGCTVIDNSSAFRMDTDVPLVVPEVNAHILDNVETPLLIANPNCSTAQLVVALAPIHAVAPVRRVIVATYQATSGAGRAAMDELWTQTKGVFTNQAPSPAAFTRQIAFNVIPHIDTFMDDGATREEWKIRAETAKILDPNIAVTATCARVPTFVGHAEAVHLELASPLGHQRARQILDDAPGIVVVDRREDCGYATPIDSVGEWAVFVSRLRDDPALENGLAFWCVSDNLRKGAALNAVQIAETLVERNML